MGTVQPNYGLDAVFGAREAEVEFMPDIGDRIHFKLDSAAVDGGGYLQSYTLNGGEAHGSFDDGRLAVVSNSYGKGRTLLVGTHPSVAYYRKSGEANRAYFAKAIEWLGNERHVTLDNSAIHARLHKGDDGLFLWIVNPTREAQTTSFRIGSAYGAVKPTASLWPEKTAVAGETKVTVPARDALILQLA